MIPQETAADEMPAARLKHPSQCGSLDGTFLTSSMPFFVALVVLLATVFAALAVWSAVFSALLTTLSTVLEPVVELPLLDFEPAFTPEFAAVFDPGLETVVELEFVTVVAPLVVVEPALLDAALLFVLLLVLFAAVFAAEPPQAMAKTHTDKINVKRYTHFIMIILLPTFVFETGE